MFLVGFPLLVVPFALYNMVAFLMPSVSWTDGIASIGIMSGADWAVAPGDIVIAIAILLLFGEVLKATRLSRRTIVDHLLSSVLFLGMLAEFLLVRRAATGTFFLLLLISFVDVGGGIAIAIRTAPRAVAAGDADLVEQAEPETVQDPEAEAVHDVEAIKIAHDEAEKARTAEPVRSQQSEAEKVRQAELEKARQAEADKIRQAAEALKARQAELEKARQAEAEKVRLAELEKIPQAGSDEVQRPEPTT